MNRDLRSQTDVEQNCRERLPCFTGMLVAVAAFFYSLVRAHGMYVWIALVGLSALSGVVCALVLSGHKGWLAAALVPWFGLLACLLYAEYFVPYQGGGASMWPIAQLVGGTVAAAVGLVAYALANAIARTRQGAP